MFQNDRSYCEKYSRYSFAFPEMPIIILIFENCTSKYALPFFGVGFPHIISCDCAFAKSKRSLMEGNG